MLYDGIRIQMQSIYISYRSYMMDIIRSIISRNYVKCKSSDLIRVDCEQRSTKHEIPCRCRGVGLSFQSEEKYMLLM